MLFALALMEARAKAGDTTALDEYAEWVSLLNTEQENMVGNAFGLMIEFPEHPAIVRAAEKLFGDRKSAYRPAVVEGSCQMRTWTANMLRFSVYRAAVREMLGAKAAGGRIEVSEQSMVIHSAQGGQGGTLVGTDAPLLYEGAFRACDYIAYRLAEDIAAAPRFELYWPEAKRDAALAAMAAFLDNFARRASGGDTSGGLTFPLRDRPASRDEARRHDAIFSLAGDGPARVVKFAQMPLPAVWTTLKEMPVQVARYKAGKYVTEKGFLQEGFVWQAEEVEVGGRWRRYYGFAGAHKVARVPAEEIEFPSADGNVRWLRYASSFEARLAPPKGTIDPDEPGAPRRVLGEPVPLTLTVRNASGLPAEAPALAGRLRLRAWYSPEVIAPQGMLAPAAKTADAWQELTVKAGAAFPTVAGMTLEAAAESPAGDIDLSAWFDLSRRGFYRVKLTMAAQPDDAGEAVMFSLGAPPRR